MELLICILSVLTPGAYSVAKVHETYATCQVPSQSKFIKINNYCQLMLNSFHIWKVNCLVIETVSEKFQKLLKNAKCNLDCDGT